MRAQWTSHTPHCCADGCKCNVGVHCRWCVSWCLLCIVRDICNYMHACTFLFLRSICLDDKPTKVNRIRSQSKATHCRRWMDTTVHLYFAAASFLSFPLARFILAKFAHASCALHIPKCSKVANRSRKVCSHFAVCMQVFPRVCLRNPYACYA